MANCKQWQSLSIIEKIDFVGKIVHLIQNDDTSFSRANGMIIKAEVQGLFEGIEICPEKVEPQY
jgi:hypothetical protein